MVQYCFPVQVELKTTEKTGELANLQRAADFVQAFILGEHWYMGMASLFKGSQHAREHAEAHQRGSLVYLYAEGSGLCHSDHAASMASQDADALGSLRPQPIVQSGFDVNDAIALLRLDDLYIESFEVKDVKVRRGGPGP